ncbi:MAG TPA: type II toxin-antitoxin system RelE/ParE family toxin [Desulfobacterales bacterium]|nr:type II toxin-antitoxin system RelE/ParE family toxin [Desulfobacterales bacterium]
MGHHQGGTYQLIEFYLEIAWIPCYCVFMIQSFKNKGTEDIFNGLSSKIARKICPKNLWKIAARKLDQIDSVLSLDELRIPPGNRLEALTRNRAGQYSVRINDQYRICFKWSETGPIEVEITDYH